MNPADLDSVCQAVATQGSFLGQHSQTLRDIVDNLCGLSANLASVQTQLSQPASPPPVPPTPAAPTPLPVKESWVPPPERYDGELGLCRSLLTQCDLVFQQQPLSYSTDNARIAYLMGLLRVNALAWDTVEWEEVTASYSAFTSEMRKVFNHPVQGKDASKRLFSFRSPNDFPSLRAPPPPGLASQIRTMDADASQEPPRRESSPGVEIY